MAILDRPVRIGVYGAGNFANRTHLPNLRQLDNVELVAVSDIDPESLQATAARFAIPRTYADAHQMLEQEALDILYSIVPAFARTDVEAAAAGQGIHLFSEKPQATTMAVARRIDEAVRQGGVLSTVCFRERYRPLFQEARRLLADKQIVHARFQSPRGLPCKQADVPPDRQDSWHYQMDQSGGAAFDWGVHAVDYMRFMTGLDIVAAQAFYYHPDEYNKPLSCSFNFRFTNSATMSMNFISAGPHSPSEPPFTIFFVGGYLALWMYDRIELDGEIVYRAEEFDPWFAQDRLFVEAVRSGDDRGLLNDYRDGLLSLAPVLAGWQSARQGGERIDVRRFMEA
jgi:myo-inositol 2-dehydrogenase / D-chiro-inositol 1-dehydrogenase